MMSSSTKRLTAGFLLLSMMASTTQASAGAGAGAAAPGGAPPAAAAPGGAPPAAAAPAGANPAGANEAPGAPAAPPATAKTPEEIFHEMIEKAHPKPKEPAALAADAKSTDQKARTDAIAAAVQKNKEEIDAQKKKMQKQFDEFKKAYETAPADGQETAEKKKERQDAAVKALQKKVDSANQGWLSFLAFYGGILLVVLAGCFAIYYFACKGEPTAEADAEVAAGAVRQRQDIQ